MSKKPSPFNNLIFEVATEKIFGNIKSASRSLLLSLVQCDTNKAGNLLNLILLVILFLFGLFIWVQFLNNGEIPDNRLDWGEITFPRLSVLQQAVQQGKLPLHIDQENGIKGVTNRYLVIPDLLLSPQVILLKWISIKWFIVTQVILLYSISFIGLLLFKRRFQISMIAFLPLFLLFNFNGHITSHLSVGHLTWTGYFLLPFFTLILIDAIMKKSLGWDWVTNYSMIQLALFIQGGYHFFVWTLFFMSILLLMMSVNRRWILLGLIFSVLINFYRLLPASLIHESLPIDFMAGFPTLGRLIWSFIATSTINDAYIIERNVNIFAWELNFFIGISGLLVQIFAIKFLYQNRTGEYSKLFFPMIILIILSVGNYFKPFFDSGVPLLSGERVSARFLILPVIIIFFLASIQIQKEFNQNHSSIYSHIGFILINLLLANDLIQNMGQWQIRKIIELTPIVNFGQTPILKNVQDPMYLKLLIIGTIISVLSGIFLGIKIRIERKTKMITGIN